MLFVDNDTGVVDVAIDPADPKVMYAAAYQRRRRAWGFHGGGPGSGLYKSIDGGDTWTKLTRGLPDGDKGRIGIAIYRKDPRIVYVCIEQGVRYNAATAYTERKAGIYRSEDKGESWTPHERLEPAPDVREPDSRRSERRQARLHGQQLQRLGRRRQDVPGAAAVAARRRPRRLDRSARLDVT